MSETPEQVITRVLAEHRLTWWTVYHWKDEPGGSEVAPRCTCGVLWSAGHGNEPAVQIASWERHLAAEVWAALQPTLAKAWDEGHRKPWRRDPDDGCQCGAWASIECGCGQYGKGALLSLDDNPYREGGK